MEIIQERKLSMYLVVKDLLSQTSNATIVTALPSFGGFLTSFNSGVTSLQTIREAQELDRTGIAVNKNELKIDLIFKAIDIARKVTAYAKANNLSILAGEVSYSESDLKKSADTILRDKCQVIYAKANANLTALATFGVTAALLTALQTAITNYNFAIPRPRLGIVTKKQATNQIKVLFKSIDILLEKMDSIVEVVRNSQLVFYKNYIDARIIIDASYSKLSLRGVVSDRNELPITGVRVKIKNTTIETKTTAKGNFQLKHLADGIYTLVVSKNGYVEKEVIVNITSGERTEITIVLEVV